MGIEVLRADAVVAVPSDALWAHPIAVLALPAFIPVLVIVGTILWIARNDRRAEAAEAALGSVPDAPELVAGEPAPPVVEPIVEPVVAPAAPVAVSSDGPSAPSSASLPSAEPRRSWRDRLPRLVIGDDD